MTQSLTHVWYRKCLFRIISFQMVHTQDLTKHPNFTEILGKEKTRRSFRHGEMENKLWRNMSSLSGKYSPFSRLAAHRFSPPLAGVSLGVISWQKCGLRTWLNSRTDSLRTRRRLSYLIIPQPSHLQLDFSSLEF